MQLRTFEDCLKDSDKKKHLMLGNGFSMGAFPDIFNYKKLFEKLEKMPIKNLFHSIGTNDFEFVMRRLQETMETLHCYENSEKIRENIRTDIDSLKGALISVIAKSHPETPSKLLLQQYHNCRLFLKNFQGKIYTFNYDLILYWVFMHFLDDGEYPLKCNDGFRSPKQKNQETVVWEIGQEHEQILYYLHGAMHIFSDGASIEKYTWVNTGMKIKDQVRRSINKGKFPVFISEGSTEHKITRIKKNGYLSRGLSSLKSISGNLFIYGHSLRDEDDHVFSVINSNNKVKNIYISLYGVLEKPDNQRIVEKFNVWKESYPKRNYYFYDAESAKVWG